MRVLCQRVERFLPEFFTPGQAGGRLFLVEPRAGADNNPAERSLRPMVVSRKNSGGTRQTREARPGHPGFPGRRLALARD